MVTKSLYFSREMYYNRAMESGMPLEAIID